MARSLARGVAYFVHTAARAANCSLSLRSTFTLVRSLPVLPVAARMSMTANCWSLDLSLVTYRIRDLLDHTTAYYLLMMRKGVGLKHNG